MNTPTKEDFKAIVDQNRAAAHVRPKDMAGLVDGPFRRVFATPATPPRSRQPVEAE